MFCIGILVDYPRNNGKTYYGRISQISPLKTEFVDFQKDEVYEEGALIRTPSKVKLRSYVAYNLDNSTGKPNTVALIKENVPSSELFRLIKENNLEGEEINEILQQFCAEELQKSQAAIIDASIEQKEALKAEEEIKKSAPDADAWRIIRQPDAFSLDFWTSYDEPLKAKMLCYTASASIELRDKFEVYYPVLGIYEEKRPHKVIYALLLFLHSRQVKDAVEKQRIWREAHESLLTSISLAYRNMQKDEILPVLKVLLPKCTKDNITFCDALLQENWWAYEPYMTCTQKGYGSVPGCMVSNQNKSIWEDFTKPHLEKVKSMDSAPDLRDLLYYVEFDPNKIPKVAFNASLDCFAYPYRISAFVLRLNEVWRYLSCRKPGCGEPLFPDFEYKNASDVYTLTKFTCKEYTGDPLEHDYQAYLNYCYACAKEGRGKKTIDSRECVRKQDQKKKTGMWLCMHCGGARGTNSHFLCPACGSNRIMIQADGSISCQESDCLLDGSKYGNGPVPIEEIIRYDKFREPPYFDTQKDEFPF